MDINEGVKQVEEQFGSRMGFLGHQIIMLSMMGQPCDVTFFKKKPALDVKISPNINLALVYGAGTSKLKEMLESIELSNGDRVSIAEIWTINPMPRHGFSAEELADVDLSEAEKQSGPGGETLRQMISETYHCESKDEEDRFIQRFLAS